MSRRMRCVLVASSLVTTVCGGSPTAPASASGSAAGTILRRVTTDMPQTFALDLDTGYSPTTLTDGGDIWFQAVTDVDRYLSPMYWDGATLAVAGNVDPGYAGCASATLSQDDVPVEALSSGLYLCVRTSEERVAVLRILQPPGPSARSATILLEYTVYNK
jgi:hypothetical protein